MNLRTALAALAAVVLVPSASMASCRIVNATFRPHLNESATSTGVSTGGGACTTRFQAGATGHFTSIAIAARPAHGALTQVDGSRYRYKPSAGFKGVDHYGFRICGSSDSGSGCATLSYNITVE